MKNYLKKISISLILVLFFSCVKDDSTSSETDEIDETETVTQTTTSSDIAGEWSMSSYSVDNGNVIVNIPNLGNISQSFTVSSSNYNYTETYNDDTSEVTINGNYDVAITIAGLVSETIHHTIDTTDIEEEGVSLTSNWLLENDNTVIISNDEIETNYTIISISDNELQYSVDLSTLDSEQINIFFGDEIADRFENGTFSSMTGTLIVTLEM